MLQVLSATLLTNAMFLRSGKNAIIYNILGFIVNDVNKFFVKHLRFSLQIQGSGKGC